ncbi:MAG: zinc metallopeptidase [Clostridiaceae bacterium]|nr:zinc metallopeptidase [Clostridiaceae bacterium]
MEDFWLFFEVFGYPLSIIALIFSFFTSFYTKYVFSKFSKTPTETGVTGSQVAEQILRQYNLHGGVGYEHEVRVEQVSGTLTDHYSPKEKTLRLSDAVYNSATVAAVGVAAHECGHAIQHEQGYIPNKIRSALHIPASIGSRGGPWLAIGGLILSGYAPSIGLAFLKIGIVLFLFATLFYFITLPVEFNASSRAIRILDESRILTVQELRGAKRVLNAAAMTYVAAAASSLITLLRLIAISRRRR